MTDAMIPDLLARLGVTPTRGCSDGRVGTAGSGPTVPAINPATGRVLADVALAGVGDYDRLAHGACESFAAWRRLPAPARGELIREFGEALRRNKRDLGFLVTLEAGKILSEGLGEVQEMIDMCDFAVGLSRQLHGLTIASERPDHRLYEQWHPLGSVGVITAFNFPVAVWAWNAAVALVCGNPVLWKPSPLTPLTALAVQQLVHEVFGARGCSGVVSLACGATDIGQAMASDARLPLISATGSCAMGRSVACSVAARLGRSLLELGGNNALIVTPSANRDLALRAVMFAAVGTAGQRCTTLRRLIVHESMVDELAARLAAAYERVPVGDPWEPSTLMGPLIREEAVQRMMVAVATAVDQGGTVIAGGERLTRPGFFVRPTLVRLPADAPIQQEETFAPILYVTTYRELDEAIARQNSVPHGLSSAIFTDSVREAERFLSSDGSDCGIANVNIGTSGAEIGGAFGGEKATGGGREAGSDSWKAYMRRQTCTINYGDSLPLAQGIEFQWPE